MTRKCSHCSNNGHNSRTCPNRGVKLFGVRLTDGLIRKSASMGNLSHYAGSGSSTGGASPAAEGHEGADGAAADGYASEDFVQGSSASCRERKRGVPWTEEEHRLFLLGLQKLGKGDWRGIARNFVVSRTPTQVASHAQKYFIRQTNSSRRKRRSSLFDMIPDEVNAPPLPPPTGPDSDNPLPDPDPLSTLSDPGDPIDEDPNCYPVILPAFFPPFFGPLWAAPPPLAPAEEAHVILRPTAVHSKAPINVEELVGISKLSLVEEAGLSLTLGLQGDSRRQSAFHVSSPPAAKPVKVNAV